MDVHRCHTPAPPSSGFAILEILIATILLAATFSMAAMLSMVSSRSMISTEARGNQQSLIESDLAGIQNLAETFTWCSGAGGFTSCNGSAPRSENYYFPTTAAGITAFETACNNTTSDTLNTALVTAINARAAIPGVTRIVDSDDIATNRLRITYTGANANRLVVFTPTVAAWCP
jgi:type II secretory pathway pseudopilin PulG